MFQFIFILTSSSGKVLFHKIGKPQDSLGLSWENFKHFHKGRYPHIYKDIDRVEQNHYILQCISPKKTFAANTEIVENIPFLTLNSDAMDTKDINDTLEAFHLDENTIPYFRIDKID